MTLHPESSLQFCLQSSKVLTFDSASIRWSLPTHTLFRHAVILLLQIRKKINFATRKGALPKQERSRHSSLLWGPTPLPKQADRPTSLRIGPLAAPLKRGADFAPLAALNSGQVDNSPLPPLSPHSQQLSHSSSPLLLPTPPPHSSSPLPLLLPTPPQQERFDLMQSTLVVLVILLIGKTLSCSSYRQLSCSVLQSRYSHFLTLSHEDGYCRIRIVVPTPGF